MSGISGKLVMERIIPAINELKRTLIQLRLIETIMDGMVMFIIFYLLSMIFTINWVYTLVPVLGFMFYDAHKKLNEVRLKKVEEHVDALEDQLTTAYDNLYKENEIVKGLHEDVVKKMKLIRVSEFVPFKKMWREMVVIAAVCFTIILLGSLNVQFIDYRVLLDEFQGLGDDALSGQLDLEGLGDGGSGGEDDDIWGNESIAELGSEELEFQINPVLSEIDINDIQDVKEREFTENSVANEIIAQGGCAGEANCNEDFPAEHKEIVKRYFNSIADAAR